jgi:two-component system chemotaxis response regulator CheB
MLSSETPVVVVAGTSAGGIAVLKDMVLGLPADLAAAVLVVMHIPPTRPSQLAAILDRAGPLPAGDALDGEVMRAGHIYIAPPDRHLLAGRRHLHLSATPRENGSRPAIDPLFRSAARHHGPRAVGVVLTGMLDDGSTGLLAMREAGGITVVQDPADAAFPEMPRNAIELAGPCLVVPAADLARTIAAAVCEAGRREAPFDPEPEADGDQETEAPPPDRLTDLTCPDCGGVLWTDFDPPVALRCRTGHRFSTESFYERQTSAVEGALWSAVRVLAEQASVADRLAGAMAERGDPRSAASFRRRAREARRQAEVLRGNVLEEGTGLLAPDQAG